MYSPGEFVELQGEQTSGLNLGRIIPSKETTAFQCLLCPSAPSIIKFSIFNAEKSSHNTFGLSLI
jgi:hypothetical protein